MDHISYQCSSVQAQITKINSVIYSTGPGQLNMCRVMIDTVPRAAARTQAASQQVPCTPTTGPELRKFTSLGRMPAIMLSIVLGSQGLSKGKTVGKLSRQRQVSGSNKHRQMSIKRST